MSNSLEISEDRVPLEGIDQTAEELVELYGGEVTGRGENSMAFAIPTRRGVAASGMISCEIEWRLNDAVDGIVTLRSSMEESRPRAAQIALLSAGVVGSLLWLLWPFFPALAPASWIGGAIMFAVYFLTLKRTSGGIAADFLNRLVRSQRSLGVQDESGDRNAASESITDGR